MIPGSEDRPVIPLTSNDLVDLDPALPTAAPEPPITFDANPSLTLQPGPEAAKSESFLVDLEQVVEPPRITSEPDARTITIRSASKVLAVIHCKMFGREALLWSQVVLNRDRWPDNPEESLNLAAHGAEVFKTLGLSEDNLRSIARAEHGVVEVEVGMDYLQDRDDREARIFPWEAMLAAATKPFRQRPLYVVRRLAKITYPMLGCGRIV